MAVSYPVSAPLRFAPQTQVNGTLNKGRYNPVSAANSPLTMTLPTGAAEGVLIVVEKVDTSLNTVTVTGNMHRVAAQTYVLSTVNEVVTFAADAAGSWYPTSRHLSPAGLSTLISANETNLVRTTTATANTSYTLGIGDLNGAVEMLASAPSTVTVPTNATVAFPVGTTIEIDQIGTGQVTILAAPGVIINSRGAVFNFAGQYAVAVLRKRSSNVWILAGDLVA